MPILDITIVGERSSSRGLAQSLADAAGAVLTPNRPGATWVRLHRLQSADYAENTRVEGERPVFVQLLAARWPELRARETQARQLCQAVAAVCGRPPDNVHVIYEPPAAGRVAFGGRLVPPDAGSSAVLDQP